jgi:hypothetical protein
VAYHILGDEHGNMFASVMNRNGVTNEIRENSRAARPSLYNFFIISGIERVDFFQQASMDERSFFN